MTEALANLFQGHDIRVLEKEGEVWFPICDLSKAWGIDPSTIFKQIERHPADFAGCVSDVDNLSTGEIRCVNEPGLYAVLAISSVKNVKNPGAKELIKTFRSNAPKAIQQLRKREIVPVQQAPDLRAELQEAKDLAILCERPVDSFLAIVLRKHGRGDLADVLQQPVLAAAAPVASQPGIWMIPQDIGNECSLNARQVNSWLYNHDFQYPDGSVWRLTAKGEAYGEEYLYTSPYKHSEIRIRWHRSILVASGLKRPLPESQAQLPARA